MESSTRYRIGVSEGFDLDSSTCSTSQQQQHPLRGGCWPRSMQLLRGYAINNKPKMTYVPLPEPKHDDFSSEPTTFTQLLAAIRAAKSIKQLEQLIASHSDRFDAVHVAAAVARLPSLLKYRPADLVDRTGEAVLVPEGQQRTRRKHGAQPRVSHVESATRLAAQLDAMLPAHVQHFFPRQAACTIWAFGELRRRGVVERMASLPDVLLSVTKGSLEPLRVHGAGVDFAQLLQGLAKLGHDEPRLMASLLPLLQEKLGTLQQRELQMVAWSLAMMGRASPDLLDAIAEQLLSTGTAFLTPGNCAAVFWAYAKAEAVPLLEGAGTGGSRRARHQQAVAVTRRQLFDSLAGSMIGQALLLAPQDVATTLWACSVLGYRHSQLPAVLGDALVRALPNCSDAEVASALESLAHLGYHHAPLMDSVADSILAEPVIASQPINMARVLSAYSKLGRRGPRDFQLVGSLAAALALRLPKVERLETVALICRGLEPFGYNDQEVLSKLATRAEALLSGATVEQLLPVLRCLGGGGFAHFQLAVASARLMESRVPGGAYSRASNTYELMYHCARQGVEDKDSAKLVLELAAGHEHELRRVDAARLIVVCQVMGQQPALLRRLADLVQESTDTLEAGLVGAALQSAEALGLTGAVMALQSAGRRGGAAAGTV